MVHDLQLVRRTNGAPTAGTVARVWTKPSAIRSAASARAPADGKDSIATIPALKALSDNPACRSARYYYSYPPPTSPPPLYFYSIATQSARPQEGVSEEVVTPHRLRLQLRAVHSLWSFVTQPRFDLHRRGQCDHLNLDNIRFKIIIITII